MTQEEKAKAYDNVVNKLRRFMAQGVEPLITRADVQDFFPELAESEDERIRKWLIGYFQRNKVAEVIKTHDILAWLEKQGEQKPTKYTLEQAAHIFLDALSDTPYNNSPITDAQVITNELLKFLSNTSSYNPNTINEQKPVDKVEPKFHEGEWVIDNNGKVAIIYDLQNAGYVGHYTNGTDFVCKYDNEQLLHLWTIQDAKDGDVLSYVTDEEDLWIMIYWSLYEPYEGHVHYHALLVNDNFSDKGTCCICINDLKPATKEQRDLLFQKMKEAGYQWDAENKELKKIEQNLASSEKTCKNDTLLDLLHKMPSCITVDGIDYHFVMKKTIAYMVYYEALGEGCNKTIFWTGGDPVDILTEMLEKLKKEGLLE